MTMYATVTTGFAFVYGLPALQLLPGASAGGGSGAGGGAATPVLADGGLLAGTDPSVYYAIAVAVMAVAVAIVVYPLVRAWARRMEQNAAPKATDAGRMHQLEQSVEALALEIERISEGQRYTTKLLTERLPLAAQLPQPETPEKTVR